MASNFDYIVVGAGSAGCAAAASLAAQDLGRILVLEAGPSDAHPLVRTPMGLVWLMGSARDWALKSTPQAAVNGRQIGVPRGRMLGGSGSINSMVWFRGRADDFDGWDVPGWSAADVWPVFDEVEAATTPQRLAHPHPLSEAIGAHFGNSGAVPPTPEKISGGVNFYNMRRGRRWSAADAFLRPAEKAGTVETRVTAQVDRLIFNGERASGVRLLDGSEIAATKGVVLSAGAFGSPEILLRSGIGPAADLQRLGIETRHPCDEIGENLQDHPAVGLHHAGPGSGYGLEAAQALQWAMAPLNYLMARKGPLASPTVEACAFFSSSGGDMPDVQMHFIPFMMGWQGKAIVPGAGYYADVCVSRPQSRGTLRLSGASAAQPSQIDLGLFTDQADLDILTKGFRQLRRILDEAPFGARRAPERYPAGHAQDDAEIRQHILARCGTAYHPVGTLRMGADDAAPVTPELALRGVDGVWVADASIMPKLTSANTNAPSMMIGCRLGKLIHGHNKASREGQQHGAPTQDLQREDQL